MAMLASVSMPIHRASLEQPQQADHTELQQGSNVAEFVEVAVRGGVPGDSQVMRTPNAIIDFKAVKKMDRQAKRKLLETVMETQDQDSLRLMQKVAERLEAVGLTMPGIEVRFQDLRVEVDMAPHEQRLQTVASAAAGMLRSAAGAAVGLLPGAPKPQRKTYTILNSVSGVLKPGRMCLLLGPPGSGRTTLMKALAHQLQNSAPNLRTSGSVTYNGHVPGVDFEAPRAAVYVSQQDVHIAEMTVAETLSFASESLGQGCSKELYDVISAREAQQGIKPDPDLEKLWLAAMGQRRQNVMVEMFAKLLGLDHVMDTVVGDDLLKGISGGQKKRVTVGEMAVGATQVMFMDEISTGLDSAATYIITKTLRNLAVYANVTLLVSLLQPSPEVYDLFDDVMVMSHGRIVFMGPREEVVPFFAGLGLRAAPGQTTADFLQEATNSADQAKYWTKEDQEWSWIPPRQIKEAYEHSPAGLALRSALAAPPAEHPLQSMVLRKQPFANGWWPMMVTTMRRELLLLKRYKLFLIAGACQILFIAFIVSTSFVRLSKGSFDNANLFLSVTFFSIMNMIMAGFNFLPVYCKRLPVILKQRDYRFYAPLMYAINGTIMRLPENFIAAACWSVMVYFAVGYVPDAGRFFIFLLHLFLSGSVCTAIFQTLGALTRNDVLAQGLASVVLMTGIATCGFPIARGSIPGWWIWAYWLSPMTWPLKALAITELTSSAWSGSAVDAGGAAGESLGYYVLRYRGFGTEFSWVWISVGVQLAYVVVLVLLQTLCLTYLPAPSGTKAPPQFEGPDEAEEEAKEQARRAALKRKPTGLRSRVSSLMDLIKAGQSAPCSSKRHSTSPATAATAAGGAATATSPAVDTAAVAVAGNVAMVPWPATAIARSDTSASSSGDHEEDTAVVVLPDGLAAATAAAAVNLPAMGSSSSSGGAAASKGQQQQQPGHQAVTVSMQLRFEPVVLAFKGIKYFVPKPKGQGELQLLDGIDGCFRPGVLTALMGASGAGKTTLMDVLAGRKTGGRAEGQQLLNGVPKSDAAFARVAGYVEQFDVHNPQATVEEALLFSARMRLSSGTLPDSSAGALRTFVHGIMDIVELRPLADSVVGMPGAGGLSTEARKRLTIAVELVSNPSLLFMDEPTSGLDARAAALVMRAVRNTVNTGRTVVCTIHQPSRDIFGAFDELLLLKPGGRVIFNGPVGPNHSRLIGHLQSVHPDVPRYEAGMNPANWMLDVSAPGAERSLGVDFAEAWARSDLASETTAAVEAACKPCPIKASSSALPSESHHHHHSSSSSCSSGYAASLPRQFGLLMHRSLTTYWRNPTYNLLRFLVTIGMAVIYGTLFWGRGTKRDSLLGVLDIMGALYSTTLFIGIMNCLTVLPVVQTDRAVFYREKAAGMYAVMPYALAQSLAEVPYVMLQAVVYSVIVYFTIQFEFTAVKFGWFLLFVWLNLECFTMFGMALMNLAPAVPLATAGGSLFFVLWNLYCGFMIYKKDINPWWIWAYYFNPAMYSIYGCVVTQLGDVTNEFIDLGSDGRPSVASYVEDTFGYVYSMRGWLVLIMASFILFFRLLSALGLKYLNFQKR